MSKISLKILRRRRSKEVKVVEEVIKLSFLDKFDALSYRSFGDIAERVARFFEIDRIILEANMRVKPGVYVARVISVTLFVGVFIFGAMGFIALSELPLVFKAIIMSVLITIPFITAATGIVLPQARASSRATDISHELPYMAAYMTTMARGGIPPIKSIERLSQMGLFPSVAKEARSILRDIRLFGDDPLTAIERNARHHPNRVYKDFMAGYVSTVRTGGDVIHYLDTKTEAIFRERASEIKTIAERIEILTDLFISASVILGLSYYVFFMISTIFPAGGYGGITQVLLFAFVVFPIMSVLIIWMMHTVQPRTIVKIQEPYKIALSLLPAAISTFLLGIYVNESYIHLFIGNMTKSDVLGVLGPLLLSLELVNIPSAIMYFIIARQQMGFETAVAEFLRDVTEMRKTGASPEKSIIFSSKRNYGRFTWIVKKLSTHLVIGIPVSESIRNISKKIRSWVTLVNLTFLADAIAVGGASVSTLDTLSIFASTMNSINKELKAKLRPYLLMPYIGAALTTVATLLVLNFLISTLLSGALATSGVTVNPWLVATLFTSAIMINSWFMGIIAGKISESYIAAGFKHAALLTFITYELSWFVLLFVIP